jgi:hypothetical protein
MFSGMGGVEWSNYRHPLPEHVFDVYMQYWGVVSFDNVHP